MKQTNNEIPEVEFDEMEDIEETPSEAKEEEEGEKITDEEAKREYEEFDRMFENLPPPNVDDVYRKYAPMYLEKFGMVTYPAGEKKLNRWMPAKKPISLDSKGNGAEHLLPPEEVTIEIIKKWADRYPDMNIWAPIGKANVVLDAEDLIGKDMLDHYEVPIMECPTILSPGDDGQYNSFHYWMKVPEGEEYKPEKCGHLEMRTGGKIGMLLPGSIHPVSNKPYKFFQDKSFMLKKPVLDREKRDRVAESIERTRVSEGGAKAKKSKSFVIPELPPGTYDLDKLLNDKKVDYTKQTTFREIIYKLKYCPWQDEHSQNKSFDGTYIIQARSETGVFGFKCHHSHCEGRDWQAVREKWGIKQGDMENYRRERPKFTLENYLHIEMTGDRLKEMNLPVPKKIMNPWLQEYTINLLIGDRGIGKTQFCMALCKSIINGTKFADKWEVMNPCNILYVEAENPVHSVKEELMKFGLLEPGKTGRMVYPFINSYTEKLFGSFDIMNRDQQTLIKELCDYRIIRLVVFDNKSFLFEGEESAPEIQHCYNKFMADLRNMGVSSLTLCHIAKGQAKTQKQKNNKLELSARGSYKQEDPADIVLTLNYPSDYNTRDRCRFITHFSKKRPIRTPEETELMEDREMMLMNEDNPDTSPIPWFFTREVSKDHIMLEILLKMAEGRDPEFIAEEMGKPEKTILNIRTEMAKKNKEWVRMIKKGQWEVTEKGRMRIEQYRKNILGEE